MKFRFEILKEDRKTKARVGRCTVVHGSFSTPAFIPVGTQGTVKTLTPRELTEIGSEIILANAYHLYLRPGINIIKKARGLHKFMAWPKAILTDSGGYQIFSLVRLRKITKEGVYFNSHFDGRRIFFSPELIIKAQEQLGSDIAMVLDDCPAYGAEKKELKKSLDLTLDWAKRCKKIHGQRNQALFGIVQGGTFLDLRKEALERTVEISFDGYSLGGLSVGEPHELMHKIIGEITPQMPREKIRYLMGLGTPLDIFRAVASGVDLFDCVNPTRFGRNGTAFTSRGLLVVRNGRYGRDNKPLDETCACYACQNFSRSYLRHLLNTKEILGPHMLSYHNVYFFLNLMKKIRRSIRENKFLQFKKDFENNYDEARR